MNLSETRKGEISILSKSIFSGLFPVITVLSFAAVPPILSLAWSSLFAALFFGILLTVYKKWPELLQKDALKELLIVAMIIVVFYGIYYYGIKFTTPGNVSIIGLTEIFTSYLFFNLWKKEKVGSNQLAGMLLIFLGALIVIFPNEGLNFNHGDLLILLAMFIAPVGNHFQQKARKKVSSITIMFARSAAAFLIMFIFAKILRYEINFSDTHRALWYLAINGILILGFSKILWLEAIHRISVTKTATLNSIYPVFTLLFAYLFLNQNPTRQQLIALLPLAIGIYFLTKNQKTPQLEEAV